MFEGRAATGFHGVGVDRSPRARVLALRSFCSRRCRSHFIKHSGEKRAEKAPIERESERESPRTRLGVNLIFYSAGGRSCAFCRYDGDGTVLVARTEAPRHLGCETGDVPSRNPTEAPARCRRRIRPLSPSSLFPLSPLATPVLGVRQEPRIERIQRESERRTPAIKSLSGAGMRARSSSLLSAPLGVKSRRT